MTDIKTAGIATIIHLAARNIDGSFQKSGGPYIDPKIVGLELEGYPRNGLPIYGNSHVDVVYHNKTQPYIHGGHRRYIDPGFSSPHQN